MNAAENPISPEIVLLTGRAYRRYYELLPEELRSDLDLVQRLGTDRRLMRVLYLSALDLDPRHVDSWAGVTEADRADAHDKGLIVTTGHHTRLTREGFTAWWQWQYEIVPHLHKPWFHALWKRVCGW